uniref:Zinc finger, GRF-type n=1 Tax=Lactuca sativa TaxID=4236 RepID=A0A9R1XST5_LACSA|nr:hypothetical protein LSAT_V11C100006620 [Lactuca sativa]
MLLYEPPDLYETPGSRCGFFGWVDSPMCQRSTVIIPGLLRISNMHEVEVGQLKMYLLALWIFFMLFVVFWNYELEVRAFVGNNHLEMLSFSARRFNDGLYILKILSFAVRRCLVGLYML